MKPGNFKQLDINIRRFKNNVPELGRCQSSEKKKQFLEFFRSIAPYHKRGKVWDDFITMSSIAIHNSIPFNKCDELEQQYMNIVTQYQREDVFAIKDLFHLLPEMFSEGFADHLGEIYMGLGVSSSDMGQFFTPYDLSLLTARLSFQTITNEFTTVDEPSIGSGGMVIAFAQVMNENGYNHQTQLFAHGIDLDSTAAHMAYIQLSLYGIPAEINIGNTLTLKLSRKMFTPIYLLNGWGRKVDCYFDNVVKNYGVN